MLKQKRADQLKQYEKQEKLLRKMKESGKSTKQAVRLIAHINLLLLRWISHVICGFDR